MNVLIVLVVTCASACAQPTAIDAFLASMEEHSRSRPGELVQPVCGVERVCKDDGRA